MSDQPKEFAGFWVRVASVIIDGLIIGLSVVLFNMVAMLLIHALTSTGAYLQWVFTLLIVVSIVSTVLYFGWFNAEGRQTIGKKFFGLAVVDTSFQPIPLQQSFWRAGAHWLDTILFSIGHLLMLFHPRKQALHDMLTKTYVVRVRGRRSSETAAIILVALLGIFLQSLLPLPLRHFYVQAFRIPTGSLKPTLLVGDFILIDKLWARNSSPERGDWVVFRYPKDERLEYVKRCIALPDDTVEIRKSLVWVNSVAESLRLLAKGYDPQEGHYMLDYEAQWPEGRSYTIRHYADHFVSAEDYGPVVAPPNSYFVLGDNRDNSADSRVWGFVPRENIIGKAGLIYWSWDSDEASWSDKIRWSRIGTVIQ